MKRYVLLLGVLLCCIMLKAQSVNYACRYWFDQNHAQAVTTYFSESTWQAELDVGSLTDGLHTLFLQVCDTSLVWEAPKSYLFYKALGNPTHFTYHYWFDNDFTNQQNGNLGSGSLLLDVDELDEGMHLLHIMLEGEMLSVSQNYMFYKVATQQETSDIVYHCWFDQDMSGLQSNTLGNGYFLLDVTDLENGMHTINIALQRNQNLYMAANYMFMKVETIQTDSLDLSHLVYHCWFDQDIEHRQTDSLGDGHILLDVVNLEDGLHTVNVMLEGNYMDLPKTYMFMKVPVHDPSLEVQYHCWFDDDINTMQTGMVGGGIFELEVEDLANGLHTVNVQLDNGTSNIPQCYMFYKRPVGGYIAKWEYWLNGEINNRYTSNLSPFVDSLSIITLLPVEAQPIRSTCFHFQPNGDEPYINAKNEITLRFWDAESHFIDKTALYVDENVSETIVADNLERNTTVSIDAPRDNQIHWFKLDAGRGDYLSFKADKACTMHLFAPSGEEVFSATGSESILMNGLNVWEDGTYYLAVHDVTGSGETVSVTYNWLNRYAIASYDVHLVGNGGCSTITFQGNGFNSLLDMYLVNYQNDTIRSLDIGHESNTTTTVSLNFYQENLGVYDAVFEFYEETIRVNGALEVQEPVDIQLTTTVSYPSVFLRNTACTYTYTITNNGNMYAYAVPIFVYIASPTLDGISHIEFDGLNLPSIIDDIDLDSLALPLNEMMEFKVWAEAFGDDHYFIKTAGVDEATGDSVVVRSNFFFLNLAPFETKTLTLKITSNEPVEVWMTVPNEIIPSITFTSLDFDRGFCCIADKIGCGISVVCNVLDWVSILGSMGGQLWMQVASCVCSLISSVYNSVSMVACRENPQDFWGAWHGVSGLRSVGSGLVSCLSGWLNFYGYWEKLKKIKEILTLFSNAFGTISMGESSMVALDCFRAFKTTKPECIEGNPIGGKSDAVNGFDPNDIYGYLSESGSHYMRQEIQNVQYEIEFENDTALATAAAHTIIVRDTLNRSRFDLNSLAARSVTIGDKRLDLNGEQTFARTLDLRPDLNVIAQVNQDYDPATGIIHWTIQSLDPMTMEPTDDPNQGVLPVNYNGNGVGFIDYSVNLKQAFADGTKIRNRAGIIFDQEDIIMTPIWTNIVDAVKPTSHIEEVEVVNDSLSFSFVSEDNRSGVWYHTLYHRNNSTEMQWQVRKPQVFGNCLMLPIDSLLTTEYLVIAVDSAGNHEEKEMVAEYTYFSSIPITVTQTNTLSRGWNWYSTYIEQEGIDGLGQLENSIGVPKAIIQSQGDGYVKSILRNGRILWGGALSSINNEEMYKIGTKYICTATMEGVATNPASHPITINKGWNWIGFPCDHSVSVSEALSGFTPRNKDVIKGLNSYATYRNGTWVGTLNTLEPGQGYMYGSGSNAPKTLVFQTGRGEATLANITPENNYYQPAEDYADNMTVIAVVELDGEELHSEDYELAAFVGDECRGSVKLMYVESINRYVAFLTVFGDEAEDMHFVLTDGTDMSQSEDFIRYETDGMAGSLGEPVTLRFGTLGLGDGMRLPVHIYPNPSKDVFNIEGVGIRKVEVTNAYGQIILSEEVESDNLQINLSDKAAGAYLLRVVTDRGVTTRKLVKE